MEIGALSLLISEKGFDATMQKVAAIDAAATKVGAKQTEVKVTALTAAAEQSLDRVQKTASAIAGTPVQFKFNLAPVQQATAALGALAEAQAAQQSRAQGLSEALAVAGQAATSTAERVKVLQSALASDQAATDALSKATLQLDVQQRDGIEIIRLRAQALTELREAQNALSRESNIGTTRVRAAPLGTPTPNITTAPELGPATREAEAFAARTAATRAAFEAEAEAARRAATATAGADAAITRTGASTERLSPRLRTAANGLTAVAFAATASGGSFQSMALGAGLAASSLASMASGPVAAWAAGIGAAITIGAAFVGVFERITDSAAHTKTAVDDVLRSVSQLRTLSEARAAQTIATRNLANAEADLARARENLTRGGAGPFSIFADAAAFRTAQKVVEQYREILLATNKKITEQEISDTEGLQAARLGIITQGTAAENAAIEARGRARLATESAQFALGQKGLDSYFASRLATIQSTGAREIAALRERQALLAEPVANATAAQSAERAAEIKRIGSEIAAVEARVREETTQTTEQRRVQREALDKQIIAFEQREQDAAGDASAARIAMAKLEAIEIARTLVQRGATPAAANQRAQEFVEAQTALQRFQQQEREGRRIFEELAIVRDGIQRRIERHQITEQEGEREIAAEERKRIPELQKIAAAMLAFATELKNPELIASAKRLTATLGGIGQDPLSPLERRFFTAFEQIKESAGTSAKAARKIIQDEFNKTGITVPLTLKTESLNEAASRVDDSFAKFGENTGATFGSALAAGISAALTTDSDKNFFESFGNVLLQGLGNIFVQMGSELLTYGLIMAGLLPFLSNPFTSGPAAIAAGTALIATGAALGAIAANNTGHRTGGGRAAQGANNPATLANERVILDPDRRIREAREAAPRPVIRDGIKAAPPVQPVTINQWVVGVNDPKAQRDLKTMVDKAARRAI